MILVNVSISAFLGLSAINLKHLRDIDSHTYGVDPAIHLPIFEGGQLRAQQRGREADADAAVASYNGLLLDAVREAVDADASALAIARQKTEQAQALAAAESAHSIATQRYQAGLSTQLTVLNTESNWLAQRRQAVDLSWRGLDVQAQLMKSLGGGYAAPASTPNTTTVSAR